VDERIERAKTAADLALARGRLILSCLLRHLGTAEHAAGRLDAARGLIEESTAMAEASDAHVIRCQLDEARSSR
jgi:hypothetical protein